MRERARECVCRLSKAHAGMWDNLVTSPARYGEHLTRDFSRGAIDEDEFADDDDDVLGRGGGRLERAAVGAGGETTSIPSGSAPSALGKATAEEEEEYHLRREPALLRGDMNSMPSREVRTQAAQMAYAAGAKGSPWVHSGIDDDVRRFLQPLSKAFKVVDMGCGWGARALLR